MSSISASHVIDMVKYVVEAGYTYLSVHNIADSFEKTASMFDASSDDYRAYDAVASLARALGRSSSLTDACSQISEAELCLLECADGVLMNVAITLETMIAEERVRRLRYGFFWETRDSYYSPEKNIILYFLKPHRDNFTRNWKHTALHELAHAMIACWRSPLIDTQMYRDTEYSWPSDLDQIQAPNHCREFKRCLLYLCSKFKLIPDRSVVSLRMARQRGVKEKMTVFQELERLIDDYKPKEPYTYEHSKLVPVIGAKPVSMLEYTDNFITREDWFFDENVSEDDVLAFTKKSIAVAIGKSMGIADLSNVNLNEFLYYGTVVQFDASHELSQVHTAKMLWTMSDDDLQALEHTPESILRLRDLQEALLNVCPDGISEETHTDIQEARLFTAEDQRIIFKAFILEQEGCNWGFVADAFEFISWGIYSDVHKRYPKNRNTNTFEAISSHDVFSTYLNIYCNSILGHAIDPFSLSARQYQHMRKLCDAFLTQFGLSIEVSDRDVFALTDLLTDSRLKDRCKYLPIVDLPCICHDNRPESFTYGHVFYDGATFNGQIIPLEFVDPKLLEIDVTQYTPVEFSYFRNAKNAMSYEMESRQSMSLVRASDLQRTPILGTNLTLKDVLGDCRRFLKYSHKDTEDGEILRRLFTQESNTDILALCLEGVSHINLLPLICENAIFSKSEGSDLSGEGLTLDAETLQTMVSSEHATLDISLHLSRDGDILKDDATIEDVVWGDSAVYIRYDSVNLSRYMRRAASYLKRAFSEYISAGVPALILFTDHSTDTLYCVFSDGKEVYLFSEPECRFIEGSSINAQIIYNATKSAEPIACVKDFRENFRYETSQSTLVEVEAYLDCKVLTYGNQMYVNLLDVPKIYGDSTAYEVLDNLVPQPGIKLRNLTYRGPHQLFAFIKPSRDLGFAYSNRFGEYTEITYSEAWFRIYT